MSASVPVTVRLPAEVARRLERLAAATARSKSWLAAEAIGAYVRSEGEFLDAVEEGRQAAAEGRTVPHDEVNQWLASWGSEDELPPPGRE